MSTLKEKAKVLLLPTEKESIISRTTGNSKLSLAKEFNYVIFHKGGNCLPQHLYILSTEKPKKGEWGYDSFHGVFKVTENVLNSNKKLIATTDKTLNLPSPTQGFIEKYIKKHNEGNPITDVLVEYGSITGDELGADPAYFDFPTKPKVNPKTNTITILPVKDSWNKEELYSIMQQYVDYYEFSGYVTPQKFIEENL